MSVIKMKIVDYQADSGSLLVSFASDRTMSQNPADYPALAFQPATMWPDVTDTQEIMRRIATAGIHIVQQQVQKESIMFDHERAVTYRALIDQEFSFSADELVQDESVTPYQSV